MGLGADRHQMGLGARDHRDHLGLGWQGETRKKEQNGYPFTTFADSSDFLGIIPRVLSDDLATVRGRNADFTDSYQSYS